MKNINTAIIGIGNMGFAHAGCILSGGVKGMVLTAVCDIDSQKLQSFSNDNPGIAVYGNYHKLLEDSSIDTVIISVPHRMHAQIAENALKKGKNVLVEKPVDISVSKAIHLNSVAQKSGKIFGIMFNQRTDPLFIKAREIVKTGQLGALKSTVWIITNWYRTQSYYDSGDWRATWAGEGGGVLLNQAPHNLDIWQWICGMPDSVIGFCDIGKYHNIEVEDDAKIFTRYKNGAVGVFITSTGEYPGTNRLEISGDLGKLVLENGILKWWKLKTSEREVCRLSREGFEKIDYEYIEFKHENHETAHRVILQNFSNAVLYGEDIIAPGTDGVYELTLSNAAYLSDWKGNIEINLPFDLKEFDDILCEKSKKSNYTPGKSHKLSSGIYEERWKVNW